MRRGLRGTNGADGITALSGSDSLDGRGGDDNLSDNGGADLISGGAGDDHFGSTSGESYDEPDSTDKISCGPGFDIVSADRADSVADDCESVHYPNG